MAPAESSVVVITRALPHSRDRLRDPSIIALFKRVFLIALDRADPTGPQNRTPLTESERLLVVPLVFGLMPAKALSRAGRDERVKPYIRQHLEHLGISTDETLVDLLKSVADQYHETQSEGLGWSIPRKRKYGIADIKALDRSLYQRMVQQQNGRCVVCGIPLIEAEEETLDHILPWRLVGDVPSGTNWQILCNACNSGKRAWFSALQSPESMNWIYAGHDQAIPHEIPTLETRYVVLSQLSTCQLTSCAHSAATAKLYSSKCLESGLAVADNLTVYCEHHLG